MHTLVEFVKSYIIRLSVWTLNRLHPNPIELFVTQSVGVSTMANTNHPIAPRVRALIARIDADQEGRTMGQRNAAVLKQLLKDYPSMVVTEIHDILDRIRRET